MDPVLHFEFCASFQVEEETKKESAKKYGKSDLRGLKVEHSSDRFKSGTEVILTLKDSGQFGLFMPLWSERAQTKERSYNFTIP
jgi:hypothetical protein